MRRLRSESGDAIDERVVFFEKSVGNTGRSVHVRGVSVGDAELQVVIGGRARLAPTFPLKVVTPRTFKISAWIVSDAENNLARQVGAVNAMLAPLNDIYRQVGVSFYLDSVIVTNIPDAFNLLYDKSPNGGWDFDRLVDVGHDTGGIECYFVNDLIRANGKPGPVGGNCQQGIVLSAQGSARTLAHEIGHAFELPDIYASNREKDISIPESEELHVYSEFIRYSSCIDDWNGGCHGKDEGGVRYYPERTLLKDIVYRLLMYGCEGEDDDGADMTIGPIRGVWYRQLGNSKIWKIGAAPIGFFDNNAVPQHQ